MRDGEDVFRKLEELISDARRSASLELFSAGFPQERVEIKVTHFSCAAGKVGDVLHPDEYIKRMVKLHHETWILFPLDQAIAVLRAHREMIERADRLRRTLNASGLEDLAALARAGRKEKTDV